jgi:hypothetical protein
MASPTYPPPADPVTGPSRGSQRFDDDSGAAWWGFAAIMLLIGGILNFIYGWAAIDSANFYINDADYVISDLNTWGWVVLVIGAIQVTGAIGLFAGSQYGRWIGILAAAANAIVQLLAIPGYPFLSLALFGLDILILYGLVAHGHPKQGGVI